MAIPIIDEFETGLDGNEVVVLLEVRRAERVNISISDAFGNNLESTFLNLDVAGDVINASYNVANEGLLEGVLTLRVDISNAVGKVSEVKTIHFLPFVNSQFSILSEREDGQLSQYYIDSLGKQTQRVYPLFEGKEILYVSASHNPLLLFLDNQVFAKARLSDSVTESLGEGVIFPVNFLPSVETLERVYVPTVEGELFVFSRDLSRYSRVDATFFGTLKSVIIHQEYLVMNYENAENERYFEVRNSTGNLILQKAQPYDYELLFSDGNHLIFVQLSEGGFFNYVAYDVGNKRFDIIGNSNRFDFETVLLSAKGLDFVGTHQNQEGLFSIQSNTLSPNLIQSFNLGDFHAFSHRSLFADGITIYAVAGNYAVKTTKSSDFPVNVDVLLSADDLVNVRAMYLVPY